MTTATHGELSARLLPPRLRPLHRGHDAEPEAGDQENAKVRRLRELHPEINVKVLYQRDYLTS